MKRKLFTIFGIICVICGSIGIVLPLVPTTPFLLLAAYLFARSSQRMHKFLLENKVFGKYLSDYFNNKPVPVKQKAVSIFFVLFGIGSTIYFADLPRWVIAILIFIAVAVSTHIAMLGKFNFFRRKNGDR
ncbi:MAG: YbaN family protein [Fibromonadales bacterium]|nr:YbaN family protein [Fibromonadales bacterium]